MESGWRGSESKGREGRGAVEDDEARESWAGRRGADMQSTSSLWLMFIPSSVFNDQTNKHEREVRKHSDDLPEAAPSAPSSDASLLDLDRRRTPLDLPALQVLQLDRGLAQLQTVVRHRRRRPARPTRLARWRRHRQRVRIGQRRQMLRRAQVGPTGVAELRIGCKERPEKDRERGSARAIDQTRRRRGPGVDGPLEPQTIRSRP